MITKILQFVFALFIMISCNTTRPQEEAGRHLVGGPCEGCEAVFEYGDRELSPVDTLPDFMYTGTRILLTGTVYEPDGRTPAEGVILYIYHTDQEGVYPTTGNEEGWARRHGTIRGWARTGDDGRYAFFTLRPGTYPDRSEPAHIHLTVLEPDGKYYWLPSYVFAGDPLLDESEIEDHTPRGGTGWILEPEEISGTLTGVRDIILGKNIPDYE